MYKSATQHAFSVIIRRNYRTSNVLVLSVVVM